MKKVPKQFPTRRNENFIPNSKNIKYTYSFKQDLWIQVKVNCHAILGAKAPFVNIEISVNKSNKFGFLECNPIKHESTITSPRLIKESKHQDCNADDSLDQPRTVKFAKVAPYTP